MARILSIGIVLVVIVLAAAWLFGQSAVAPTPSPSGSPGETREVKLFYYDATRDVDSSGNIMCTAQGLVPVARAIPVTQTPIQDAIRLLLEGGVTAAERIQGITTGFPLEGVTLVGAAQQGGTLTLEFADPNNKTGGGSCRVTVLWAQVEATAKQFPGITEVRFTPEELFQP